MKAVYFSILFLFVSIPGFSQNWKPYKIDDSVQVSLPQDFERKDTLGQTLINAEASYGNILITISPDDPRKTPDIEKEKHLKTYYDNFVSRLKSTSPNGFIREEKDTMIGKLSVKDVTLGTNTESGKQLRDIRIIHVNSATYTFQYIFQDMHTDYAVPEIKTFFNSIKIPPDADLTAQLTQPENTTGQNPASKNASLYIYLGLGIIILLILFFIFRRHKKHH